MARRFDYLEMGDGRRAQYQAKLSWAVARLEATRVAASQENTVHPHP